MADTLKLGGAITPPKTTSTTVQAAAAPTAASTTDWEAWKSKVSGEISDIGKVYGDPYGGGEFKPGPRISQTSTDLGNELIRNNQGQYDALEAEGARARTAAEMVAESTFQGMENIDAIKESVTTQMTSALDAYNAAVDKSAEYAEKSDARMGENLAVLDRIFEEWNTSVQFDKAHAMQTAVVSTMEGFKKEERHILENYGRMSPEYEQFRQGKSTALAALQSNIHVSFGQLKEQRYSTYLNVVNEAMWKQNMYTSFQEQQHVEMLKYMAGAKNEYFMQYAQFAIGVEQLKMEGMENLANWITGTPSFVMDNTPLVTILAELSTPQIIGTEPVWQTQSVGRGTSSQYVDKPIYAGGGSSQSRPTIA